LDEHIGKPAVNAVSDVIVDVKAFTKNGAKDDIYLIITELK